MRPTICVSLWMPPTLKAALLKIASKKGGLTLSKIMLIALHAYVEREEGLG